MMGYGYGAMGSMMGWMMGSGMVWMGIWLLLAIAGLSVLVVVLVKLARGADHRVYGSPVAAGSASLLILEERYARGEIDDDEYHHRRGNLH